MNLNIFNEIAESELGKRTRRKPNMSSNAIEFRRRQKERRELRKARLIHSRKAERRGE